MKKKLKIFIAGHKGMVGRSLVKFLTKKQFGKLILKTKKELNLEDYKKVDNFLYNEKPEVIINCAGKVGGILANSQFPTEFLNENLSIQTNLINLAYKHNIDNLINLGSSCIYPKNSKQPIKEKYLLTSILEETNEAYALAKIVGLKLCEYYNKQFQTSYLTLMPCNLYGPHDNFDAKNSHFIPALIRKIVNAKIKNFPKIELWGTGKAKREIMHVDDLASAIYFILKKKINNDKKLLKVIKKSSLINVGTGYELSIKKFAKIIIKIENSKLSLVYNKNYPDGMLRKVLDNKIMSVLGWKASISTREGLKETIKWYKNNHLR